MKKIPKGFSATSFIFMLLVSMIVFSSISITTHPVFSGGYYPGDGAGNATIYVTPQSNSYTHPPADVGDTFTVHVNIANYTHVASWQAKFVYDKSLLNTSSIDTVYSVGDFIFPSGLYVPTAASVGNYNLTHDYVVMSASTYSAVEYDGSIAGLMDVTFTIISVPADGETNSCLLWFEPIDTWTVDTDIVENSELDIDSYYQITTPLILPYLAIDSETLPDITGDRVVGDHFILDITIHDVPETKQIILVQYVITYDPDYLKLIWISEGTFMNDSDWAPYGTYDNVTLKDYEGYVSSFILINPNATTGEWDWGEFPEGEGLLATVEFEVAGQPEAPADPIVSDINIEGVFNEFFVTATEEYAEYNPPQNGTLTLGSYNWDYPVVDFSYTPSLPEVNETITFDASDSYGYRNTDGTLTADPTMIASYEWDFGDENITTTTDPVITHSYPELEFYNVTLTVTDEYGENVSKSTMIGVVEILIHEITYEIHTFYVQTVSNGRILPVPMNFNQKKRMLYFNITGPDGIDGFVNITIPNALLSAAEDEWAIIVGGELVEPVVVPVNATHTMLYIPLTFSTHNVYIIGTSVIPEFPINNITLIILGLFFAVATFMAFSLQKKRKIHLN